MRNRLLLSAVALPLVLLMFALALAQSAAGGADHYADASDAGVVGLATDADGLSFSFLAELATNPQTGLLHLASANAVLREPGMPHLPYFSGLVALPPGTEVQVTAKASRIDPARLGLEGMSIPLEQPVVSPAFADWASERMAPQQGRPVPKTGFPDGLYTVSEPMYVDDLKLVRLSLFPVRLVADDRLELVTEIAVSVRFIGARTVLEQTSLSAMLPRGAEAPIDGLLNWDQARGWSSPAPAAPASATLLPAGKDVYKLGVNQDGIYELTYENLQAAGMAVDEVNPLLFQMVYDGLPVAYELTGDGDSNFEPGESVLFYGWAYDGSRRIKQYVKENVFWLWEGSTPNQIGQVASVAGAPTDFFNSTITREEDHVWSATWTNEWPKFDNEPDAWYWEVMDKTSAQPITLTKSISLPNPASSAGAATFLAEFTSKPPPSWTQHVVQVHLNGAATAEATWPDYNNVNITGTIDAADLVDGANFFDLVLATAAPVDDRNQAVYLNRISVTYPRLYQAVDDELYFQDQLGGARQFDISGVDTNDPGQLLIWRLADRLQPTAIDPSSVGISGSGPYTLTFGSDHSAGTAFIATTRANTLPPASVEQYVPPVLEPDAGGADWLAISYGDFVTETLRLAQHRSHPYFGGHITQVVDISDVVYQYGYGLPSPVAIERFLSHARSWSPSPQFLLLVGDATLDPRGINTAWTDIQFVPVDLPFVDRYQGQVPSDFVYSLLEGDDLVPEIAVGRLPARTPVDAAAMVDKVITYEQNQLTVQSWNRNALMISGPKDSSTNFCAKDAEFIQRLPASFNPTQLCLDQLKLEVLRSELFHSVNEVGTTLLSYRGHGSVDYWQGPILTVSDIGSFTNGDVPFFGITADCLDGFFAHPERTGMGEAFVRHANGAAAAYWSSSGLGFPPEHTILENGLFHALFSEGVGTVGEAINHAKVAYLLSGNDHSILYTFVLQGDPAMMLYSVNALPEVEPDFYEMYGSQLEVGAPGLLANDRDPEQGMLTATVEAQPQHGTVLLSSDGAFVYNSPVGFSGLDSFSYRATDEGGAHSVGEVLILVGNRTYLPYVTKVNDN